MLLHTPTQYKRNKRTFIPVQPVYQTDNWTCSAAATAHALQSIGIHVGEWDIVFLLGKNISVRNGLEKGNGADLQEMLINQFGLTVKRDWLTFSEAHKIAGRMPLLLGGANWDHWCSVIGTNQVDLLIANPAPTWKDVGSQIDRREWDLWGSWAGIWIEL